VTLSRWAHEHLGIELAPTSGEPVTDLVGVALRRNPRRVHLLVSTVLGKHLPADPSVVHAAATRLGERVSATLGEAAGAATVLGYAETATGLGHGVAEALGTPYLHSTRQAVPGVAAYGAFEEEHSHATSHLLLPEDPALLDNAGPIVLVDDELSTGRTALNTVRALQARVPRERYVIAALVDVRAPASLAATVLAAERLGTRIDVVALGAGHVALPNGLAERAAALVAQPPVTSTGSGTAARTLSPWPRGVRESGRHGFGPDDVCAARAAAAGCAAALADGLAGPRVLVLGSEELMYAPQLIALQLQACNGDLVVRSSSTTRSPAVAIDVPGYPIRTVIAFDSSAAAGAAGATDSGIRFAYNVAPVSGADPATDIVLVVDEAAATPRLTGPSGAVTRLAAVCERLHVVVVPTYLPQPALVAP
jgi:adenine/guanine phosphoribosyltransferase-like PRPP-binding protein